MTITANSEREILLKRLDHVVAAWVPHSDLCRDCAQQIRADGAELTSLRASLSRKDEEIEGLRAVIRRNHEWHEQYDEYGGYPDSELCQANTDALAEQTESRQETNNGTR